jgi:hypothetical protein
MSGKLSSRSTNTVLDTVSSVASKVMSNPSSRTPKLGLGKELFVSSGRNIVAIEQNPNTGSSWAQLAKNGSKVVQYKDTATNKYVGVSVDGVFTKY